MRKNYIMFLFAAMALLAGCAKEEIKAPVGDGHSLTITLGQTKTHMDGAAGTSHKIYWSNKDKISVNGNESDELSGLGDTESTATFHFAATLSTPYNIVYPASIYKDASTVTLPATQTYKDGGFADGMYPMAGYSADGSSITINHLCAMVKVAVKRSSAGGADTDNLVSVTFRGRADEQVSGDFSINYGTATLTGASSAAADKEVRVEKILATSTSEAAVYYIVVPARTYSNGISISVQDVNGDIMTKESGAATLAAGKLYTPAEMEFVPNGVASGIEIATAEDLIAFATAYNAKTYDDLGARLVAKLTSNITFDATSSAAFNATGGIGTPYGGDNYFNGSFNGNNKTISGLEVTVPIFGGIGENGTVKDLTLDNSCVFSFTQSDAADGQFATVAGYHKGILDNVKVAADVTLASAVDTVSHLTALGGLVGRATVGKVQNGCEYSGLITTPASYVSKAKLMVGGLVGRFSNAGSVSDSYFKGAISNSAKVVSTDKSNPYLIIGGVAGYVDGGATISSTNTTADHAVVDGAYAGTQGIIVNKTEVAYHSTVGGIVGEIKNGTVSSCVNDASILVTIIRATDDDSIARYIRMGGIVGKNHSSGIVNGCTNNGTIQNNSNARLQYAGGIVGYNAGTIEGDQSVNNGAISFATTGVDPIYGARIPYIGGIVGENTSSAHVSNVRNNGNLTLGRTEMSSTGFRVAMGGIIAYNSAALDGGGSKNIVNTGRVQFNTNINKVSEDGYYVGGVVGYSSNSVQNVKNSGYVYFKWGHDSRVVKNLYLGGVVGFLAATATVSGCVNEGGASNAGEVYFQPNNKTVNHTGICIGGIIGGNKAGTDATISNCQNSGKVWTGNYTATDQTLYLGGIIGSLTGKSSISDCANTGINNLNAGNNTDDGVTKIFADGGIVGFAQGTDENHITISGCSWSYDTETAVGARRGTCGGIAAYAEYADISNSDVTVQYNMYNHVTGGVVGWAVHSTLTNCKFKGTKITATQGYWSGGVVAKLTAGSVVDGCYNYCDDITAPKATTVIGEIAAISETGTEIKNCHHTGTIDICSDTNYTGSGNVADL